MASKSGRPGFAVRFVLSSVVAILVVFTMFLTISMITGTPIGSGPLPGAPTGRFILAEPGTGQIYMLVEIIVGIVTFLGSYYVMSR